MVQVQLFVSKEATDKRVTANHKQFVTVAKRRYNSTVAPTRILLTAKAGGLCIFIVLKIPLSFPSLSQMHWCFPFMSPDFFFFVFFSSVNYLFPVTKQPRQYLMWSYCHKAWITAAL